MTQTRKITKIAGFYIFVGFVGVWIAFYPTLLSQFAKVQGYAQDTRFVNYVLEHSFQFVFHHQPGDTLWTPKFFFPFENTLALSENLLGVAPLYWFARFWLPPDLAYQGWTIVCAILCYLCFATCLRLLRVSHALSALGGFVFGFGLVRIYRLFHPQLLPQFFTPVALLFVWNFLRQPTANSLRVALLLVFLQIASSFYLGWFLLFALLIFVPLVFYFDRSRLKEVAHFIRLHWKSTIVSVGVWLLALVIFLFPYLQMVRTAKVPTFSDVETMLPRLASWVYPPPDTLWYSMLAPLSKDVPMPHEHRIFMGFMLYGLVGLALYVLSAKRSIVEEQRICLIKASLGTALILVALTLYLAPGVSLWAVIYRMVPGATVIRAVGRIALIVELFLLVAAFLGLDSLLKRSAPRPRITSAIVGLLLFALILENLIFAPAAFVKAPILQTEAELEALMRQGCEMAYVNSTPDDLFAPQQVAAMWAGLRARVPVINGYSGSRPVTMPGADGVDLSFSSIVQWLQSFERSPTGRFCLIAAANQPLTATRQVEAGVPLDSIDSATQYFSRDRRYTAFVIPLPSAMPQQAYAQGIRVADQPKVLAPDQTIELPVFVRNTSPITWVQTAKQPIRFSYRWVTATGVVDAGDTLRTELPTVVPAGRAIALNAAVKAPPKPGEYLLRLTLVHETVAWFMDRGAKTLDFPVTVIKASEGKPNEKINP